MDKTKSEYAAILEEKSKNAIPDQEIKIEGIGTIKVFGTWDPEKIIKKLLEYEEFTG